MKKIIQFIFAMIISFVPGIIGMFFTPMGGDKWFGTLAKSSLTPDGWVFAVAWCALYAILGLALYLIMRDGSRGRDKIGAYIYFIMHMVMNALWTYVFFGMHLPVMGMMILAILVLVSIWMMMAFMELNRVAGWLVLPYVLWLIFAAYLNGAIVFMQYNLHGVVGAVEFITSFIK